MTPRDPTTAPRRSGALLLTGVTGFLGAELLARLLQTTARPVIALIRAGDEGEAQSRLRAVLAAITDEPAGFEGRVRAVRGDLTEPGLGLAHHGDELAEEVDEIVHGAASVSFTLAPDASRAINVQGTGRVLELAERIARRGGLERLTYVSTAYAAGVHRGVVAEESGRRPTAFRNAYEQSKREAEELVLAHRERLPLTVVRPSIFVGHRASGWTSSFNVIYAPLRAFAVGAYPVLPARRRAPVDVVSVDYVADATLALAAHPGAVDGAFHVVAGAEASTVGELVGLAASRFERRAPRLVSPRLYRSVVEPLVLRRASRAERRALERSGVYFPYFDMRMRFDDARARALLDPAGVRPAPIAEYFDRLIDFAQAAQWGRRPLGRAAAAALAQTPAGTPLRPDLAAALGRADRPASRSAAG